jgi:hypothetical protein
MGLTGYRLWVMGQLDSTCRAPPRVFGVGRARHAEAARLGALQVAARRGGRRHVAAAEARGGVPPAVPRRRRQLRGDLRGGDCRSLFVLLFRLRLIWHDCDNVYDNVRIMGEERRV